MKRVLIITGLALFASARAYAPPPGDEPQGDPLGAGCVGGPNQEVIFQITERDFRLMHPNRPWTEGNFSPTDENSPCALGAFD